MTVLEVNDVCVAPPDGAPLIEHMSFSIAAGEVLVVMGPSGCGKSTLLSWLTGTLPPGFSSRGTATIDGNRVDNLATERRRIGLVLQSDYLFPHMSVADNLLFGLRAGGRHDRRHRIEESLEHAGLGGFADRDPATLSGGQRARVSLLRTLMSEPAVLLLDEPFSRLDAARREQIRQFTWAQSAALPVLLVTHDLADVPDGARVLEIQARGQIAQSGVYSAQGAGDA